MNPRLSTLALLLVGALAAPASAASDNPVIGPYAYTVSSVYGEGVAPVRVGSSQPAVTRTLGHPYRQLSTTLWLYRWYSTSDTSLAAKQGCDVLVVTLAGSRVADMKLVNPAALNVLTTAARSGTVVTYVTSDKPGLLAVVDRPRTGSP